uniref:Uncharacterized protein n=1 Tax=Meloidogyne hapla TaxID=6305 RepID=A0A1I8B187_MELHA
MGIKQLERMRQPQLPQPQHLHNNTSCLDEFPNGELQQQDGSQFNYGYQLVDFLGVSEGFGVTGVILRQLPPTNSFTRPLSRQSASTSILSVDTSVPIKTKRNRFKQLFRRKSKVQT